MGAFAGVVVREGRADAAIVRRLCAALPGGANIAVHTDGPVAVGGVGPSAPPVGREASGLSADGRRVLAFNGDEAFAEEAFRRGGGAPPTSVGAAVLSLLGDAAADPAAALPPVARAVGPFALALWDSVGRTLLLARDAFGKKPLYTAEVGGGLVFSTSLRAVLAHPGVSREIDPAALATYLAREVVPAPATIRRAVRKISPGAYAVWRDGRLSLGRYDDLAGRITAAGPLAIPFDEAKRRLRESLHRVVVRRLAGGPPVALLISGGLDSSSMAAALGDADSLGGISAFSTRLEDPVFDETPYADAVLTRFRPAARSVLSFGPAEFREAAGWAFEKTDEPIGNVTILPLLRMARAVRDAGVRFGLVGTGADELFAGFQTFQALSLVRLYRAFAGPIDPIVRAAVNLLPASDRYFSIEFRAKRFLRGVRAEASEMNARWQASFDETEVAALLPPDVLRAAGGDLPAVLWGGVRETLRGTEGWGPVERLQLEYLRNYMAHDTLPLSEVCGAAFGVEFRAPYLDPEIVDLMLRLPAAYKIHRGRSKHLMREAYRGLLPDVVYRRHKQGFTVPVARWLKGPLRDLVERHLVADGPLYRAGLLRPDVPRRLVADHFAGRHSRHKEIWTLLALSLWFEAGG